MHPSDNELRDLVPVMRADLMLSLRAVRAAVQQCEAFALTDKHRGDNDNAARWLLEAKVFRTVGDRIEEALACADMERDAKAATVTTYDRTGRTHTWRESAAEMVREAFAEDQAPSMLLPYEEEDLT